MIEMTIPSVLDPTLAPPGCHVVSLFTQFTPYHIEGREWTEQDREAFADTGASYKTIQDFGSKCGESVHLLLRNTTSNMLCLKLINVF